MNILIDVEKLIQDGVLTPEQASRLKAHAGRETGLTAINVLLALGAVAIAIGVLTLFPSPNTGIAFGVLFVVGGYSISKHYSTQWGKLGSISLVIGALLLYGSADLILYRVFLGTFFIAIVLGLIGVVAESRLLIGLTPIALCEAIASSVHLNATDVIVLEQPTLTIIIFAILGCCAWQFAKHLQGVRQSLALIFGRVCVVLVNMGFWIGSLCGDSSEHPWHAYTSRSLIIPDHTIILRVFALGWAGALFLTAAWGVKNGRRFIVNTVAVFGSVDFFTQWFEFLGMRPLSVVLGGVAAVTIGLGLWRYNRRTFRVKRNEAA